MAHRTNGARVSASTDHILIIGTGFAGLGMGIRLKQAGVDDFTILEQADGVGGTWRVNHYPGAACDIESHLYSFSFEQNADWSRMYATQKEILAYLEHCADKYDLRPHIRFNVAVKRAVFDERTGVWDVEASDGKTYRARVVVSGCGGLSRPSVPQIKGLASFEGKAFHSARWDHTVGLSGKRVAVVGTGASSIQIVPAIAPKVARLYVYQRSPAWIVPKNDRPIGPAERARFRRLPFLQRLARDVLFWKHELMTVGFVMEPGILRFASKLARSFLKQSVADPVLREKLLPSYAMGCKRVLPSNDFYPAIQRENVELVTSGIDEVLPHGIRTLDGKETPLDAIVLATGFQAAEACAPFEVRGRAGTELNAAWRDGAEAYLGTTVSGFPNLFLIVGPNTGLGSSSMVLMIESQIEYTLSAIQTMRRERLLEVEVRPEVQTRFNRRLHQRLAKTVWSNDCNSWYKTKTGKNTTLWPGFTLEFRYRTRRFDADNYELREVTGRRGGREINPSSPPPHLPVQSS